MSERYLLKPEVKNLSEVRGIEQVSLSFEAQRILEKLRLERVIVHNRPRYLELMLAAPERLSPDLQEELEKALAGLTGVQCKITGQARARVGDVQTAPDWNRLLVRIKQKLPGVYSWLSSAPFEAGDQDGLCSLCLKITNPLAVEYIRRREEKLQALLREETGRTYLLSFAVVEEEQEIKDFDEELRREAQAVLQDQAVETKGKKDVVLGKRIRGRSCALKDLPEEGTAVVEGEVFKVETRPLKSGKNMCLLMMTDFTDSLTVKAFFPDNREPVPEIQEGGWLRVKGRVRYDEFQKEPVITAQSIQTIPPVRPRDETGLKRVELHLHTKMSAMDSVVDLRKAVELAAWWGHPALAVTDHGGLQAFPEAAQLAKEYNLKIIYGMEGYMIDDSEDEPSPFHVLLLVRNMTGLSNLYRLVSDSHLRFFHRHPRIPKSLLARHREGLLVGTACESGELFSALLKGVDAGRLAEIVSFYDFLEIQPLGNNDFLIRQGKLTREELIELNRHICRLGEEYGKPVVATGDVHFLRPQDEIFRRVLLAGQSYEDADRQPPLYFRSTAEMLAEFSYLSPETAHRVVVENPVQLAESIEQLTPVPEEFSPPAIAGAPEGIRQMAYSRAREIYGDPLPARVHKQLEWELKSIITHGYAVIFLIAHKLVKKSLENGYLVGSRGSVGSSLVATMCGITEVNPLPAHYLCSGCRYSEFPETGRRLSGVDLPVKNCPHCGLLLQKDGHDIPFATFMGFEGDKEPDIDLNFSGEYQAEVHRYTEELFGKNRVFRAGTITTLAEKTAFGFVRGYLEARDLRLKNAEINRLVKGCSGVKRSTGQHPGGMMVVPAGREIYDFTPVQYPANDREAEWITTHFDYRSLSGRLVKLDILGHDDPTVLKMLFDLTGVNPAAVPLDDPQTMALFSSAAPLGLEAEELGFDLGTLGIPEFGTEFVRQMLAETKPSTFSELVYISGLSHGAGVWLGNAQELIEKGVATLSEVISTRDDIMNYLIHKGLPPRKAFGIMEQVRKGKGLSAGDIKILKEYGIPDWYIEACRKITYMFPKAHAVAYVMMAFRIAFFKVHYPEAFYASYFTVRADEFDAGLMLKSAGEIREMLQELKKKANETSAREKNLYTILELVREALLRKIHFLPVDLYQSDPAQFLVTPEGLRVPLVSLPGLGKSAALCLDRARRENEFYSVEDLKTRARLSSAVIDVLEKHGCLKGLPANNQLTLF